MILRVYTVKTNDKSNALELKISQNNWTLMNFWQSYNVTHKKMTNLSYEIYNDSNER